jgi:hypothetical protein
MEGFSLGWVRGSELGWDDALALTQLVESGPDGGWNMMSVATTSGGVAKIEWAEQMTQRGCEG